MALPHFRCRIASRARVSIGDRAVEPSENTLQSEPPAGAILNSNPWRCRVVHEAAADVKRGRITNPVEPLVHQGAGPLGRAKSIALERVVGGEGLAIECAVRRPRAKTVDYDVDVEWRCQPREPIQRKRVKKVEGGEPRLAHAGEENRIKLGEAETPIRETWEPSTVRVGAAGQLGEHARPSPARLIERER